MCSVQVQLLSLKHHDVKNIDFYASQEVFFCLISYLQDMAKVYEIIPDLDGRWLYKAKAKNSIIHPL